MTVEAIPMYNLRRGPAAGQLFHRRGRGNGHVVRLGGRRLYFAADTECVPEIRAFENIDAAFMPMKLPYPMPPSQASDRVRAFKPAIVDPYHFRVRSRKNSRRR